MIQTMRYVLSILPLGLLLTGCAGTNRNEFGSAQSPSTSSLVAADTAEPAPREANRRPSKTKASPSRYEITLDEIREHVRNNSAVIVDARSPEDFSHGHVRGAINVPSGDKEASIAKINNGVATQQIVIIYCASAQCPAS